MNNQLFLKFLKLVYELLAFANPPSLYPSLPLGLRPARIVCHCNGIGIGMGIGMGMGNDPPDGRTDPPAQRRADVLMY